MNKYLKIGCSKIMKRFTGNKSVLSTSCKNAKAVIHHSKLNSNGIVNMF